MWSCWWLTKMVCQARGVCGLTTITATAHNLGHNVKILADYDRPPWRKISGKGLSFPPYVVFVVVNKKGMSPWDYTAPTKGGLCSPP